MSKPLDLDFYFKLYYPEFCEEKKMNGYIVRLIPDKGFGFIKGEDGEEYFFHREDFNGFWTDLQVDIDAGRRLEVTFDVVPSQKGPRAGSVMRVDAGITL